MYHTSVGLIVFATLKMPAALHMLMMGTASFSMSANFCMYSGTLPARRSSSRCRHKSKRCLQEPMYCVDASNDAHWLWKLDFFVPSVCVFMMLPYGLILLLVHLTD